MKKILIIAVSIVAIVLVLGFFKDLAIKISVEKGVKLVTGLKLSMRHFSVGLISPHVDIKGLKLFNPPAFKDRTMIDMPEIYVAYDLPAILKNKIHLPEVRLALKEFVVVKNEAGKLNLDSLKVVQANKEGKRPAQETAGKAPEIQIDSLYLNIKKAVYKDYSGGGAPRVTEFNININEEYHDIKDPYSLVSLIVVRSLTNTAISNITGFDLKGLNGTISDTLANAQQITAQTVETAKETARIATDTAKTAESTAKETVKALTDVFKSPFGAGK